MSCPPVASPCLSRNGRMVLSSPGIHRRGVAVDGFLRDVRTGEIWVIRASHLHLDHRASQVVLSLGGANGRGLPKV